MISLDVGPESLTVAHLYPGYGSGIRPEDVPVPLANPASLPEAGRENSRTASLRLEADRNQSRPQQAWETGARRLGSMYENTC